MQRHESATTLGRADLIRFETVLSDAIGRIIPFSSHSLHFPKEFPPSVRSEDGQGWVAAYIPDEHKLLLPLLSGSKPLALFVAGDVTLKAPDAELSLITSGVELCMDHLALYKQSRSDPQTGAANRNTLITTLQQEIDLILTCIQPGTTAPVDCPIPGYRASFGLLLFQASKLQHINLTYGYVLGDALLDRLSRILREQCPEHALTARVGGDAFAILWPQANPRNCRRLGERIRTDFSRHIFTTKNDIELTTHLSVGFVNYPQDMLGWQLRQPSDEQCRTILDKGRQALTVAAREGGDRTFSFKDILAKGGRVKRLLPLHRMEIDLGKGTGIQEGHRFLVWPAASRHARAAGGNSRQGYPHMPKGEIVVMETGDTSSIAEVLHLNDPAWMPSEEDLLTPVTKRDTLLGRKEVTPPAGGQGDLPTGLLSFGDFLRRWSRSRQAEDVFSLVLIQVDPSQRGGQRWDRPDVETLMRDVAERSQQIFGESSFGGRYSTNCLTFYLPGVDQDVSCDRCTILHHTCSESLDAELVIGVAGYPCLDFSRADILDNCRKALDHAIHQPELKLAGFGSVSLNINADRLFTNGDLYSAIDEYKLSLLADPDNLLARNSLGICYARLGMLSQARKELKVVIDKSPDDLMARYNFGFVCLRLAEQDVARSSFERCLELSPGHVYSLLRLGQMEEKAGNLEAARAFYLKVAQDDVHAGTSHSHLARIATSMDDDEVASEHLHKALVHNPMDAHSLHLLAELYLKRGEDPEIAESLARKSTSLRPENSAYWDVLARALDAMGKPDEAATVRGEKTGRD